MNDAPTHLTGPLEAGDDQSPWPLTVVLAAIVFAAGVVLWRPLLWVGLLALALTLGGWVRDVAREARTAEPPQEHRTFGLPIAKHEAWVLALGVGLLMLLMALLRVGLAHGLFVPEKRPEALRELSMAGPLASTLVLLGSLALAWPAFRGLRGRDHRYLAHLLGGMAAFGALFILLRALEWWSLAEGGFGPSTHPIASVFFGITAVHALYVGAAVVALVELMFRAHGTHWTPRQDAHYAEATLILWVMIVGFWLVVLGAVYLELVTLEEPLV